jgi:hypothetical protein
MFFGFFAQRLGGSELLPQKLVRKIVNRALVGEATERRREENEGLSRHEHEQNGS